MMLRICQRTTLSLAKPCYKIQNLYTIAHHHESHFESINVKCGGSGNTTIHIHNAPKTTPLPLLLYISPTTDSRALTFPSIPLSFLSQSHTTVLIRPLFSPATPFPQALHVLSYAYDEILKQHAKSQGESRGPLPPISVYGKGLGGTLATVLGLTECQPMNEARAFIDVVMSRDAIYDYSPLANEYLMKYATKKQELEGFCLDDYMSSDSDLAYANPLSETFISGPAISTSAADIATSNIRTREDLIESLPHLFSRPEIAYDPFISPVLFFRGRSHDIPTGWTWKGPIGKRAKVSLMEHERSRSYVKYPPKELGLRIPWSRLCVTASTDEKAPKKAKRATRTAKEPPKKMAELTSAYGDNLNSARDGATELQTLYSEQAGLLSSGMRRAIEKNHEDPRLLFDVADVDASERVQVIHNNAENEQERDEMDGLAIHEWLSDIRG